MKQEATIDTLVFDFGNVIIDLDLGATWRELEGLLGRKGLEAALATSVFDDYETGQLSDETYLNRLQRHAQGKVPTGKQLVDAWNAMLLGIPQKRLTFLSALREKYRVFLLSNTNALHLTWVDRHLKQTHGMSIVDYNERYFERAYYSHEIELRKPDQEIYSWVAEDAGLNLDTTLFIDDNADNIAGARKAGWRAHLHPIGDEIAVTLPAILA